MYSNMFSFRIKQLLQAVCSSHGRILIYVWAIEQDELSKRKIPVDDRLHESRLPGQDVFVPWNLNRSNTKSDDESQIFNRYYHMFAKGELTTLVTLAAEDLGLYVGPKSENCSIKEGVEIVQDGWERSNYYIELRCWKV